MAQSDTDDRNGPHELPEETKDLALSALASLVRGKTEDELLSLMKSLRTVDENCSNSLPDVKAKSYGEVSTLPNLSPSETTADELNEISPETQTLSVETEVGNKITTELKPVTPCDSGIVSPDIEGGLHECDTSKDLESKLEMEKSACEKEPLADQSKLLNSQSLVKPEIPRRVDLEEQKEQSESLLECRFKNHSEEKDTIDNTANQLLSGDSCTDEIKRVSENNGPPSLNTNNYQSTFKHEVHDGIIGNSDAGVHSVSGSLSLEGPDVSVKPIPEIPKNSKEAQNQDICSIVSSFSDSGEGTKASLSQDSKPLVEDPHPQKEINNCTWVSSNTSLVKNVLTACDTEDSTTKEQPSSLDGTIVKLSAMSDGEDMAPSTPPSGEGVIDSSDNSSLIEISDAENELVNNRSDNLSGSLKQQEILNSVNARAEAHDPNETLGLRMENDVSSKQETAMSSPTATEDQLQEVSTQRSSAQDLKGSNTPILPLYYLPQIALQDSAPVLVLQPVMGTMANTANTNVPYGPVETTVPFGPLILPISPSGKMAQVSTLTCPSLQSNGLVNMLAGDDADKQTSSSQTLSIPTPNSMTLNENDSLFSASEEDLDKCFTGKGRNKLEDKFNRTQTSPFDSGSEVERWEKSEMIGQRNENMAFDDQFSPSNVQGSSVLTSTNPFATEMEKQVEVSVEVHHRFPTQRNNEETNFTPMLSPGARPKQRPVPSVTNPFNPDPQINECDKIFSHESEVTFAQQRMSEKPNEFLHDSQPVHRKRIPSDFMVTLIESNEPSESSSIHQLPSSGESAEPFASVFADQSSLSPGDKITACQGTSSKESNDSTKKKNMPGYEPPYWVPDEQAVTCFSCDAKFNLLRRRHHCRGCGQIFCDPCCSQLARLPYMQHRIGRICITCTNTIIAVNKSKREREKKAKLQKRKQTTPKEMSLERKETTNHNNYPSITSQQAGPTATTNTAAQQQSPAGQVTYLVPLEQYTACVAGSSNDSNHLMYIPNASPQPSADQPVLIFDPSYGQPQFTSQLPQAGLPYGVPIHQPSQVFPIAQAGFPVAQAGFPIALPTQHPPQMILAATPTNYDVMTSSSCVTSQLPQTPPSTQGSQCLKHRGDNTHVVFTDPHLLKLDARNSVTEADLPDGDRQKSDDKDQPDLQAPTTIRHFVDKNDTSTNTRVAQGKSTNDLPLSKDLQAPTTIRPFVDKNDTPANTKLAPGRFTNYLPLSKNVQSPPLFTSPHNLDEFKTTESKQNPNEAQQKRYSVDEGGTGNFITYREGVADDSVHEPSRPAGVTISWKKTQTKSKLLERKTSLARDLKELQGVTVYLAEDLLVYVKKEKIEQTPRNTVPLWCYRSKGLSVHGQKEVILLLEQLPKETVFPTEILRVYRAIYNLVKSGTTLDHGNYLTSHDDFVLDIEDSAGLLFVSNKLQGQTLPNAIGLETANQPFLYCLIYMKSERQYAMYTPTRLLLRLGQKVKQYPFPLWNPRKRAPVYFGFDKDDKFYSTTCAMNKYLKNSHPEAFIPGLHIVKSESKVILTIPAEAHSELRLTLNEIKSRTSNRTFFPRSQSHLLFLSGGNGDLICQEVLSLFERLIIKGNQSGTVPMLADISTFVDSYVVFNQIAESQVSHRKTTSMFRNPLYMTEKPEVVGLVFIMLHLGVDSASRIACGGELLDDGVLMFLSKLHTVKFNKSLRERSNCYFHLGDRCDIAHFELRWSENTQKYPGSSQTVIPRDPSVSSRETPKGTSTVSSPTSESTLTTSCVNPQSTSSGSRVTSQGSVSRSRNSTTGSSPGVECYPGTAIIDIYHAGYASEIRELKERVTGDPTGILRAMESEMRTACTDSLMLQARKMKPKERKELQLRLVVKPGYKKWAIGPPNQPDGLFRSMQMALNTVCTPEVTTKQIGLSFFVVLFKQ